MSILKAEIHNFINVGFLFLNCFACFFICVELDIQCNSVTSQLNCQEQNTIITNRYIGNSLHPIISSKIDLRKVLFLLARSYLRFWSLCIFCTVFTHATFACELGTTICKSSWEYAHCFLLKSSKCYHKAITHWVHTSIMPYIKCLASPMANLCIS